VFASPDYLLNLQGKIVDRQRAVWAGHHGLVMIEPSYANRRE
jgi:hypothetical protein